MSKMVEVELYQYANLVFGKVLHVDESLYMGEKIIECDGYSVESYNEPQITSFSLYLPGKYKEKDNQVVYYPFNTVEEAEEWIRNIKELLEKINNRDDKKNKVIKVI